ncbi:hypothetical protein AVEN_163094-1 [Araneus ventricosus]|uniref:Uncharacterized protein n=1 Tax=Araneus ventricosus TaxID=182803 RepID=A0A4Y2I359_ARAVE|nr:hypothetical protein AVEN_163094-1 [Araneus ventricosus]
MMNRVATDIASMVREEVMETRHHSASETTQLYSSTQHHFLTLSPVRRRQDVKPEIAPFQCVKTTCGESCNVPLLTTADAQEQSLRYCRERRQNICRFKSPHNRTPDEMQILNRYKL